MTIWREIKRGVALLLALMVACPPAQALINLNEGREHIYVTGTLAVGWDSNVFANRNASSDQTVSATLLAEYTRRAGWIGVNASVAVESTRYNTFTTEDFDNPAFSLEFTKQTGRTTGSVTLRAARQSRADAAINVRSVSWNYDAGLNFRYPIVGIYTLSGQAGYSLVQYEDPAVFPDLATYTLSAELIRLFSSDRDVLLGYRFRRSETSVNTRYDDLALNVGMTGKLIRGINGRLTAGYQVRKPSGRVTVIDDTFQSWTAAGSATYALNKRLNLTGNISKDFSTTATTTSVDTLTAGLDLQYAYSSHWSLVASASMGESRFLGESGRIVIQPGPPAVMAQREDTFVTASASINYSLNEHLKASFGYTWFRNWSNNDFSDFIRSNYNFNVSSRW